MPAEECALRFDCAGCQLYGIAHIPAEAAERGVLIVVGGPQYRIGSHRQFVLLARELAEHGMAVLRFDCRGMGDSEGEQRTFEEIGADLRSAVDAFFALVPPLRSIAIWGLCDGATAAAFYAGCDHRVGGVVLLNPWVRSESGAAEATLRHYYRARLLDWSFWRKLAGGGVSLRQSAAQMIATIRATRSAPSAGAQPLPDRMLAGLQRFEGRVLLILSGADLTAREFADLAQGHAAWRRVLARAQVQRRDLPAANHTFSRRIWRDQVALWTREWLRSW